MKSTCALPFPPFFRACHLYSPSPTLYPRASALYLFLAGDRLLLSQWGGRATPSHESGDRWYPGGHHRPECLWISSLHIRQTAPAQVGVLWEIPEAGRFIAKTIFLMPLHQWGLWCWCPTVPKDKLFSNRSQRARSLWLYWIIFS